MRTKVQRHPVEHLRAGCHAGVFQHADFIGDDVGHAAVLHRNDDLQRAALKALLDQPAKGAFVSGAQMDKSIARMIATKRRAHAVQN